MEFCLPNSAFEISDIKIATNQEYVVSQESSDGPSFLALLRFLSPKPHCLPWGQLPSGDLSTVNQPHVPRLSRFSLENDSGRASACPVILLLLDNENATLLTSQLLGTETRCSGQHSPIPDMLHSSGLTELV